MQRQESVLGAKGWGGRDSKLVLVLTCTTPSCSPGCFHTHSIFLFLFNCPPAGTWSRLVPCIPADMCPCACLGPVLCPRVVPEAARWLWTSISWDKIASIPSSPCQVSLQREPSCPQPCAWHRGLWPDSVRAGAWAPQAAMLSWGLLCPGVTQLCSPCTLPVSLTHVPGKGFYHLALCLVTTSLSSRHEPRLSPGCLRNHQISAF